MNVKGKKYLLFATVAAVLFIILNVWYAQYITNLLTSESRMHLSEVATQGAASVQRQIARDFDMLEILADGSISNPEVPFAYKMERIKKQAHKFGLYRIGIVDLKGNAATSDGHHFSVADRDFFKGAVTGQRFLSQPIIDKVDGVTPGIVYAVPVYHDNQVVNVLFSGYELDKLTERIDISFYHKRGLAFIVNSKGDVLLHPNEDQISKNIVEIAAPRNSKNLVEHFQNDLEHGEGGVSHFAMRKEDLFFAYAPIEGANDWFLFTSLPASSIFDNSRKVILFTIALLVGFSVIFTLAALYIAITKKKSNAKIFNLAYYDSLTGAANMERFKLDAKSLFQKSGTENYSLINFDVKHFRYLNNHLGYDAGNQLLIHITHCLATISQKNEIFARAGNDRFLLLLSNENNENALSQSIKLLRTNIASWQPTTGGYYTIQLAFGIYKLEHLDTDIVSAIEKSNIARKAAKNGQNSAVAIYDTKMQCQIDRDTELEKAMPLALEQGEFKLFIQPKYDLLSEKIVGGEALVRWIKPDGTMIMPDDFIILFEQTNAIERMDFYMLEQLCKFLRSQLDRGICPVPISINQSRRYMYSPRYVTTICEKLQEYQVPTQLVELEITENIVYTNLDKLIHILDLLHEAGFYISLDDFGSGYSSLNVLKDLPIDTIKLDRFMLGETLNSQREKTVVANMIHMAKELQLSVVAEGVETWEQVVFLRECGCEMAQGYYYSKPIPAQQFDELL
ncbi:MAG: EAL domain-containing protein [Lachnospiraceae bacterium]